VEPHGLDGTFTTMTETTASDESTPIPPGIDTSRPHPARVYDFILGGTNHFPVDRQMAELMFGADGGLDQARSYARANRAFLGRVVRYLIDRADIRQFLDIGTGIPGVDNVHGVAQRHASDARIVYVDNDPLVLAHAGTLIESTPDGATAYIDGDLRDPQSILLRAAATLDVSQPIAIMLIGILHMIGDDDDPYGIVTRLLDAVPSGSYLAISHMTTDIDPDRMAQVAGVADRVDQPLPFAVALRPIEGVARFLDGLEIVEPGIVGVERWHPDDDPTSGPITPIYAVLARKP
jgi:hypothetical protein